MGGVWVVWLGKSAEKKCTDIDVSLPGYSRVITILDQHSLLGTKTQASRGWAEWRSLDGKVR